jgi:nucleotide-binding universal stress UspA family protein
MTKVMVPLDGSAFAERAVPYAAALARAAGRLLLVRVAPGYRYETEGVAGTIAADSTTTAELDAAAERAEVFGLPVETHLVPGTAAAASLVAAAAELGADLIVMSTHGRSGVGRFLYGSVADEVLRQAPVPVVLVPAAGQAAWPMKGTLRVLVPLDGSELARRALGPLAALARVMPVEAVLVQVVPPPAPDGAALGFPPTYAVPYTPDPDEQLRTARRDLDDEASRLAGTVPVAGVRVELGPPATTIVEVAREEGAHLIAMATHGRAGLSRLVMGSVATGVLRHAAVPLLLVPSGARAGSAFAPEPASLPAPAAGSPAAGRPTTVRLTPDELMLVLHGLDMALRAAENDAASRAPISALRDRLQGIWIVHGQGWPADDAR